MKILYLQIIKFVILTRLPYSTEILNRCKMTPVVNKFILSFFIFTYADYFIFIFFPHRLLGHMFKFNMNIHMRTIAENHYYV